MIMNKHTPGPWSEKSCIDYDDWSTDTGGENTCALVGPKDGDPVCIVVVTALDRDVELNANVALIAAAPDILEALKLARDAMGANAARDAVDAAIAKAEGAE